MFYNGEKGNVNMKIIQTNDNKSYQTPSKKKSAAAIYTGTLVQSAAIAPVSLLMSDKIIDSMWRINDSADKNILNKAITDAFQKSDLSKKGLKLTVYNPKEQLSYNDIILNYLAELQQKEPKEILKKPGKIINDLMIKLIEQGYNAGFDNKTNTININTNKMGTAFFHELGHAINFNNSAFWKSMQKVRMPFALTSALLPFVAISKRKKAPGEEPKNILDKTTDFVKNNIGKLTFISMVPIIAEELKATQRGNKIAKTLLSPELYKKVVNSNKIGAASYIATALSMGFGAYLGNLVRDKIAKPAEIKK